MIPILSHVSKMSIPAFLWSLRSLVSPSSHSRPTAERLAALSMRPTIYLSADRAERLIQAAMSRHSRPSSVLCPGLCHA